MSCMRIRPREALTTRHNISRAKVIKNFEITKKSGNFALVMKKIALFCLLATMSLPCVCQPLVRPFAPNKAALTYAADTLINNAVARHDIPGAVLCIVQGDETVYLKAYGNKQVYPTSKPMTTSTIFDLASLSKPTGAGLAAMLLIQRGQLHLEDRVADYIPAFATNITIENLLTHTSGLPPYANVKMLKAKYGAPERDSLIAHIAKLSMHKAHVFPEMFEFNYSCLNFITLQRVVEVISGMTLKEFCDANTFGPLGMTHTTYCPPAEWQNNIAPTEYLKDEKRLLLGEVHDPLARVMNAGISGNAGVFTNAEDLALLAKMFLHAWHMYPAYYGRWPMVDGRWPMADDKGQMAENNVFTLATLRFMSTYRRDGRTLGWDSCSDYSGCKGEMLSPESFCHTGYTGTEMVIDPVRDIAIILLTNRAHPSDGGAIGKTRARLADILSAW